MRSLGYWTGAFWELLVTPFRENNPLLGAFVLLALIVEFWAIAHVVEGLWP